MLRRPGVVASIVVFAVCIYAITLFLQFPPRGYYFGHTKDSAPVVLFITGGRARMEFTIPRNFLGLSSNWEGGIQDVINVEAIIPSFEPLALTNKKYNDPGVVLISLWQVDYKGSDFQLHHEAFFKDFVAQHLHVGQLVFDNGEVLDRYIDRNDSAKYADVNADVVEKYVPLDHHEIYFDCVRNINVPGVGCTAHTDYRNNLGLDYSFGRVFLGNWRSIDMNVRKLLDQFLVGPP